MPNWLKKLLKKIGNAMLQGATQGAFGVDANARQASNQRNRVEQFLQQRHDFNQRNRKG